MSSGTAFVTLTYNDENLPASGSLVPDHLKDFLKRFREKIRPLLLRFYAVGEYGEESNRPHYHLAIYGFGPCVYGRSRYDKNRTRCCVVCDTITDSWGLGFCYVGELEIKSAAYVAGYLMKKISDKSLGDRHPVFARMSLRPGIGAWAMDEVASSLLTYKLDAKLADVPESLRHGGKLMPLGRYLKGRLRERIGRDPGCPEVVLEAMAEELLPLSRVEERYSAVFGQTFKRSYLVKADVVKASHQVRLNQEARLKIYKQRKSL